jgi:membrane-associated phospholipid phosphatase
MAKSRAVSAVIRCASFVICAAISCRAQTLLPRVSILPDAPVPAQYSSSQPTRPSSTPLVNGDVSWKTLPFNILRDQKVLWLFPLQLAKGQHLIPAAAIVGTTAGLIQADPPAMRYFGPTTEWNRFNETFNGAFTGSFEAAIPASLYVFGLVRHDSYAERTALLAGEAYADSAIPHVVIKIVARRVRPNAVMPGSDYTNTFFHSTITPFGKGSSFPSGHAAGAFSIATVIARRYGDHRWVPFVAYGLAALVSFSRVPDRAHYPSDVFLGAALGYMITRYDTLREKE